MQFNGFEYHFACSRKDVHLCFIMSTDKMIGSASLKVIGTDTDLSAVYDFLLTFYSNHGHMTHLVGPTVFEINGDFSPKSQNFQTPVYFMPRCRGSSCNWAPALGVKN